MFNKFASSASQYDVLYLTVPNVYIENLWTCPVAPRLVEGKWYELWNTGGGGGAANWEFSVKVQR